MESEVADMAAFFGSQYTSNEGPLPSIAAVDTMPSMHGGMMGGGSTIDEIIMQNSKEMERRRSVQEQLFATDSARGVSELRRDAMIDFGSTGNGELNEFHFHSTGGEDQDRGALGEAATTIRDREVRRASMGNIDLSTHYRNLGVDFRTMAPTTSYQSHLHMPTLSNFNTSQAYITSTVQPVPSNAMLLDFETEAVGQGSGDLTPINMYSQRSLHQSPQDILISPLQRSFGAHSVQEQEVADAGLGTTAGILAELNDQDTLNDVASMSVSNQTQGISPTVRQGGLSAQDNSSISPSQNGLSQIPEEMEGQTDDVMGLQSSINNQSVPQASNLQSSYVPQHHRAVYGPSPSYDGAYSSSGFDMMHVLTKVATRPNPQINIGAVDMSCAFVVADVTKHDMPILYCSDVFERLTGYTKHEILGRNCRFLQSPDGKVQGGVKRKYVDDDTVYYLKTKINANEEAQTSLINYRKGGQPFMNLLTMIPIAWDTDKIRFIVGFQVDLVEQPSSVSNKNPNGSYLINYQRAYLPRYVLPDPARHEQASEPGYTVNRDDVSTALTTVSVSNGESELTKRIWDKVLLENTDDVVHVLSLKGLFLYLSPSSRKVLEYDAQELVGTALSTICHPSDIVPVTRELKDTSSGASVSVVFRIRRKHSGYTWFESHGSLHTDQGKGRKCIILVGRERPVYVLSKKDILANGGIGENELWTKMSTSGMFLFVSSTAKILLDKPPEDLIGTSIQALMRPDSRIEFGRALEIARTGKQAQIKHELINKRGQNLQAQTFIYPGDAIEGQKPTFFVAQTKLLKPARAVPALAGKNAGKADQVASGGNTPSNFSASSPNRFGNRPNASPQCKTAATVTGGKGLPIGTQDISLASEENVFDELKTTRSTSWQFELRQMEKRNRLHVEELQSLLQSKKKRKRGRGAAQMQKDCANCHTRVTPEWRRGPSGKRDLCNSCGLRWAKQNGKVSPRTNSDQSDMSPNQTSPHGHEGLMQQKISSSMPPPTVKGGLSNATAVQTGVNSLALPNKMQPTSPVARRKGSLDVGKPDQQP